VKQTKVPKAKAMSSTLRCLRVMELLAEAPFELGVTELAERLASPVSSVHRLCATLVASGFVEADSATKRYRLSPKSLWVGSGYLRHSEIYRGAFFPMQELARKLPGTVQLGVLDERSVVFIHSIGYSRSIDAYARVGLRRPLHATATGKLFLVDMSPVEVDRVLAGGMEVYTDKTICSPEQLKAELGVIAQRGYATNDGELLPGYFVIAAPIFGRNQHTIAAISVTLPSECLQGDKEAEFSSLVVEACAKISLQLGFASWPLSQTASRNARSAFARGASGR
jgi:DNA-binding IclR family transcriptional regulator